MSSEAVSVPQNPLERQGLKKRLLLKRSLILRCYPRQPSLFALPLSLSLSVQMSLLEDAVLELRKFQGEMRVKEASVNSLPMEIWDASSLGLLKGAY